MNRKDYISAFDSVAFDPEFEQKTAKLLHQAAHQAKEKEQITMKKPMKKTLLVAAILAVLAVSVTAAALLLQPKDVANQVGDTALAGVFASDDATILDQTVVTGDYTIGLLGIVSGKGLSQFCDAEESRSYAVVATAFTDGRAIVDAGEVNLSFSPLIAGFKPWQVNGWTLGGGYRSFVYEGVFYALFDCADLEIFADHTVYLAVYEGFAPDNALFQMADDGSIAFAADLDTPHALFTLPLDAAKADPAAVQALVGDLAP